MRRGVLIVLALLAAVIAAPVHATGADALEGVRFEHRRADAPLLLSGTFVSRWKGLLKVSVAGLWLPADARGRDVLDPALAKHLEIHYLVGIDGERLRDGTREILARNWPADDLQRLRPGLDRLVEAFTDVAAGDSYALRQVPGSGVQLLRNGRLVAAVDDDEVSRRIFSVWLGREPLDTRKKAALLAYRHLPAARSSP